MEVNTLTGIKSWAEEDRPREKMLLKGRQNLTNAELLAIILGSGTRDESAVQLAQRMLAAAAQDLSRLGRMSPRDLQTHRGVGEAKALAVAAALELGRRRQLADAREERSQVKDSRSAYEHLAPLLEDLDHEEFYVMLLNQANKVLGCERISSGGITGTVVDARLLFRLALEKYATSVILAHNHPSGQLRPSQADIKLTHQLIRAGETLEIKVVDHLIIGAGGYYSLADQGEMA
jgi:DNA repair protein RadC